MGGLAVIPSINYAATSLNSGRIIDESINGIYAADAGVEAALWSLSDNASLPSQLSENINRMDVAIQTEDKGFFTVYFGELIQTESHSYYLDVTGDIEWESGNTYKYTITVTWQPGSGAPTIHLTEVGVRPPPGYSYQDDSAAIFAGNLSTAEPDEVQDGVGAWMVNWEWGAPYPTVTESEPSETQTFYINGEGDLEGDYPWVVANRSDIGEVGELTGSLYIITSTATEDGEITAKIVADVMMIDGELSVVSWQVTK